MHHNNQKEAPDRASRTSSIGSKSPQLISNMTRSKIKLMTSLPVVNTQFASFKAMFQPLINHGSFKPFLNEYYRRRTTCHNKKTSDCISYWWLVITNIFRLLNTPEMTECCTVLSQCLRHQSWVCFMCLRHLHSYNEVSTAGYSTVKHFHRCTNTWQTAFSSPLPCREVNEPCSRHIKIKIIFTVSDNCLTWGRKE